MPPFVHCRIARHFKRGFSGLIGFVLTLATIAAASASLSAKPSRTGPPNILLILADDLGWSDLGCQGGDLVETPNLDRLARAGVRFTQAYSPSPVCSPTRASILTGKSPARLGMTIWSEGALNPPRNRRLLEAPSQANLPRIERTLADVLQRQGYFTGIVGKWHLGDADHAPETRGFLAAVGGTHWGAPASFFWPYRGAGRFGAEFRYVPGLGLGRPGEYLTDRLTDEALKVIDHAGSKPFFLMLSHHAPHTPIEAPTNLVQHFQKRLRPGMKHRNPAYAAMIKAMDDSVGRVLAHLKRKGLLQDTLVVFTSDNGGYIGADSRSADRIPVTDNFPLRSGKGTCYEGGIRVPLIVSGPGVEGAGRVCETPVILTDLFPTFSAIAGLGRQPGEPTDGLDLGPVLSATSTTLPREDLFFHYPHHYHAPVTEPMGAVRSGNWKLVEHLTGERFELFDLSRDPSESRNLIDSEPAKFRELRTKLENWRRDCGAQLPRKNPDFKPNGG